MAYICYVSKHSYPLSGGYRRWPTTKSDFANNVLVCDHTALLDCCGDERIWNTTVIDPRSCINEHIARIARR